MSWKVTRIRLGLEEPEAELPRKLANSLGVGADAIERWRILRRSLDARRHDEIHYLYSAEVELKEGATARTPDPTGQVTPYEPEHFLWPEPGAKPLGQRPVVVGAGPAGLFAAYFLAEAGYRPLVLERGKDVKDRVADVRKFDQGGEHDPESNYLYGEGGAGTFSDGKLTCRSTGPDVRRVLELMVECHGKPAILYEHRPHLGSNRLPLVVRTLRKKIEQLGGEVQFNCRFDDVEINDGQIRSITTSSGRVPTEVIVLAIGHSARDTYQMLLSRNVPMEFKPFQFGVRIEQPQEQVNFARYGVDSHPILGAADYSLQVKAGDRDLFTFCMCAGGYVMPSVSESGYFCTNGMSESYHDSPFANSGLVMTIGPNDVKSQHPLAGIEFQRAYEKLAFEAAKGSYHTPIQSTKDFLAGRITPGTPKTSYPRGALPIALEKFLPNVILSGLRKGLPVMDRQMRGQFLKESTIVGPESRGSSPIRIPRNNQTRQSPTITGLYPCGEGAGYAGGIISAAVDGLATARAIVAAYAKLE